METALKHFGRHAAKKVTSEDEDTGGSLPGDAKSNSCWRVRGAWTLMALEGDLEPIAGKATPLGTQVGPSSGEPEPSAPSGGSCGRSSGGEDSEVRVSCLPYWFWGSL